MDLTSRQPIFHPVGESRTVELPSRPRVRQLAPGEVATVDSETGRVIAKWLPAPESPVTAPRRLTVEVIATILSVHRSKVPAAVSMPLNGLTAQWPLPSIAFGYSPATGEYVGCTNTFEVSQHADSLVVLSDNWVPSEADLARVMVNADGRVEWEPA